MSQFKIGWIGVGTMGTPICRNLLRANYPVFACNIDAARLTAIVNDGAEALAHPSEIARRSDIVISMVPNDKALLSVVEGPAGLAASMTPGKIFVDMSTGGISLEKGQSVVCLLGSADRDPAVYSDPDRLDITRRDVRPLSFGGGIHYCVGAQLARIEAGIAVTTLLHRLPNLQLDDIDCPDWRQTFVLRGLNKLPASW
jgi:hypothetical protein